MIPEEKSREQKKTLVWIKRDQCARAISGFVATVSSLCHVLAFVSRRESGGRGKGRKDQGAEKGNRGRKKEEARAPLKTSSLSLSIVVVLHRPIVSLISSPVCHSFSKFILPFCGDEPLLPLFFLFLFSFLFSPFPSTVAFRFGSRPWPGSMARIEIPAEQPRLELKRNSPLERDKAWRR